jgi:hypothetical protein
MSGILLREPDPHDRYKLLCEVVVPRPIAPVTTPDENGNLYAAQRDIFALTRENHARWLARNGAVATSDETQ